MNNQLTTNPKRSSLMRKIKSSNTKPEILLRQALWKNGIRFRISNRRIFGNPDISIKKHNLAIFIDGEFWHGFNWNIKKRSIKSNREYWLKKIERNIQRDLQVNKTLSSEGWIVIRFWSQEVIKSLQICVDEITDVIQRNHKVNYKHTKPN